MFENESEEMNEIASAVEDYETEEAFDDVVADAVEDIYEEKQELVEEASEAMEDAFVDLDEIADTAIEILQTILKPFDVGDITIDEYDGDDGELILDITGDDLAVLIGRHGRTLDAMQFLLSSILRRKLGYRYPVIVDVEGYKSRQRQKIESIARSAANRASSQAREVSLRPMSPYERRIVHITLKEDDRVETESEGEGADRHVVVIPK